MRLPCETLAGFLLMFSFATEGTIPEDTIWGTLGHDIYLNISEFTGTKAIEEIRWATKEGSIARFRNNKQEYFQLNGTYEIFENGTLKIKQLMRNFSNTYKVTVYNTAGALELEKWFYLEVLEMVSKPNLFWDCSNTTLTCEVVRGTDPQLMLYLNGKYVTKHEKIITHKWTTDSNMTFKCKATNHVSEKYIEAVVNCAGKGLDIFLIVGICVGGLVLIVFVVLLFCYVSKRKKRNSRSEEELEIRAPRPATEERARKLPPLPTSAPASAAASPPPPPPVHGSQAPGHRPLPPVHRAQQQKQKRPPPSGTQVYQQRGPPLPRPRVQPKPPPHGAVDNSN